MVIATFRDLKVWHKAHGLVLDIYRITKTFPVEETKYHILLSRDLGYLAENDFNALGNGCDEIGKMLYGFYQRLSL